MVEASNSGNGFITEVPGSHEQADEENKEVAVLRPDDSDSNDEDETEEDQAFQVDEAKPPTNYDDAYSTLPMKIKLPAVKVGSNRYLSSLILLSYVSRKTSPRVWCSPITMLNVKSSLISSTCSTSML